MCLLPVCTMLETFTTKLIAQFLVTLRIRVFISSMIWNVRCCLILSSGTYLWCFEFAKFGTLRNTCCGGTNIRQCRSQEDQLHSSLYTGMVCMIRFKFSRIKAGPNSTVQESNPNHGESTSPVYMWSDHITRWPWKSTWDISMFVALAGPRESYHK
jgi:hypothetical protein